ncbi:MAG: aspartate aminotransferase family protein [Patescibacteria group bacterium]|nr:aspartate aminotransferase family protein [Patescibacteria group bacterium]
MNNYILNLYLERNLEIVEGENCYLFDDKGNKYLDFMSNYGVNILGYKNKEIESVIKDQLYKLFNLHGSFGNKIRDELAKNLLEKCQMVGRVFFLNSGAEAIEAALKFAIYSTNKKEIISMKNSYHGKTLGALSLTFGEKYRKGIEEFLIKVKFVEFGNLADFERNLTKNTGVVVIEPIQGDGGINLPPDNYLKSLSEICRERNIILIVDEIQTGFGRTGKFLASQHENIYSDIICLGKGMANGLPLSAVLVSEKIAIRIPKFFHTSTFGGNLIACRISLKILEILDDNFLEEIKSKGHYLIEKLKKINNDLIVEIRGKGLIIGIEVKEKRTEILKRLQENFILAIPAGENVIRLLPPYIISEKEINHFVEIFQKIINSV